MRRIETLRFISGILFIIYGVLGLLDLFFGIFWKRGIHFEGFRENSIISLVLIVLLGIFFLVGKRIPIIIVTLIWIVCSRGVILLFLQNIDPEDEYDIYFLAEYIMGLFGRALYCFIFVSSILKPKMVEKKIQIVLCGVVGIFELISVVLFMKNSWEFEYGSIILIAGMILSAIWIVITCNERAGVQQSSVDKRRNVLGDADKIQSYKELLDAGIITQDEFAEKKRNIIDK